MANLYLDEALPSEALTAAGGSVAIGGEEGRHAVRVSRLRVGERILIGNGRGVLAECVTARVDRDSFEATIVAATSVVRGSPRITLVQALAKGDRDERAVEQATEFGVDAVLPWQANRSVSRWAAGRGADGEARAEKSGRGVEKWRRIAREAAKQSVNAWVPDIGRLHCLPDLLELAETPGTRVLVLHPEGESRLGEMLHAEAGILAANEIVLVVGPEGGLDEDELRRLELAGAVPVRLGATVLRTSSAGPAAIAMLNQALGRW